MGCTRSVGYSGALLVMSKRLGFRVGQSSLALEVPPFFINFEKRNFSSIMARSQSGDSGILVYIYITRMHHVKKLLVLKGIHPDLYIPQELHATKEEMRQKEIEGFIKSVEDLEESWVYQGEGIWLRRFGAFKLSMILIIGEDRWTVRPAISKKGVRGYGVEIPVDTGLAEEFKNEMKDGELEEIHDHTETQHFHLTVPELDRYIELAKKWDYYFSEKEKWKQSVRLTNIQ